MAVFAPSLFVTENLVIAGLAIMTFVLVAKR